MRHLFLAITSRVIGPQGIAFSRTPMTETISGFAMNSDHEFRFRGPLRCFGNFGSAIG